MKEKPLDNPTSFLLNSDYIFAKILRKLRKYNLGVGYEGVLYVIVVNAVSSLRGERVKKCRT